MKTLSYIHGKQREIVKGESYYLGELWDGNGDAAIILYEKGKGAVCSGSTEDGIPLFVDFTYAAVNMDCLLDTIVTVIDVF